MNLFIARSRLYLRRLGAAGLAGLVLAAGAAIVFNAQVTPARESVATLEVAIARLEADARRQRASNVAPPATVTDQLGAFYARLPPVEEAIVMVAKLNDAAVAADLKLQSAEYRLVPDPGGRLARYQVSVPVAGSYPQIRKFVGAVLQAVPAASLDEIVLKRDSTQATRLEAQLKLTVYLRVPPDMPLAVAKEAL